MSLEDRCCVCKTTDDCCIFEWTSQRIKREDPEGYERAKTKYEAEREANWKAIEEGTSTDYSDFWMSFNFALDTYTSFIWGRYFEK